MTQAKALNTLRDAIYEESCVGCCLHIVLDDFNIDRPSFEFCLGEAKKKGHPVCEAMASALLQLTDDEIVKLEKFEEEYYYLDFEEALK
jgi:hypothetical protein